MAKGAATAPQATPDSPRSEGLVPRDTLSITDNRTGKTYEVPITHDTIKAIDLRQIKVNDADFGMMSFDPGFTNTAHCESSIIV